MSGFDRALGAMSRREMLECARGLLKVLAGEAGGSSAASGGAAGIDGDVARAGGRGFLSTAGAEAGVSGGGAFGLAAAGRAGRYARQTRGGGRTRREDFSDGPEGAENVPERGEDLEGPERRERRFSLGLRERESAERGDLDRSGDAGAAFAGPERRYDNATGARGMEMSRVSDYFRRDSRRYDAGYTRF